MLSRALSSWRELLDEQERLGGVLRKVMLRWNYADKHTGLLRIADAASRRKRGRELGYKVSAFSSLARAGRKALRIWSGKGLVHAAGQKGAMLWLRMLSH